MSRLLRAFVLLLLAGTFLAASFLGGLVHSVLRDFARGTHAAGWWIGAGVVLIVLIWRWRRRSGPRTPSAPPSTRT